MVELYPYQKKWLADDSRFKIGMFARQCGKTFTSTLEIVIDCLNRKARWVILSRGERQAREAIQEGIRRHCEAFKASFELMEYPFDPVIKVLEVQFPNGSKISALPANPDTARGFSASVLLDEFAFHQQSRRIWQALFPVISAGHKLRVISTPNGKGNKFYELMTDTSGEWSKHQVDIYEAVRQGLPRDIDQLRRALNDPDGWAQEYELQWLDEATAWLDYDLIASCESEHLPEYEGGECYLGWDVARRRDLSVLWVLEQVGDVLVSREMVALQRESFQDQLQVFDRLMERYRVRRACLDQTGMGEVLVELCKRKWGEYAVEGLIFSNSVKQDLAVQIKRRFEDRKVRIPIDREVRDSLHSVKKITLPSGNSRFDAERDEVGHADHFWALALAIHAGDVPRLIQFRSAGERWSPPLGKYGFAF